MSIHAAIAGGFLKWGCPEVKPMIFFWDPHFKKPPDLQAILENHPVRTRWPRIMEYQTRGPGSSGSKHAQVFREEIRTT